MRGNFHPYVLPKYTTMTMMALHLYSSNVCVERWCNVCVWNGVVVLGLDEKALVRLYWCLFEFDVCIGVRCGIKSCSFTIVCAVGIHYNNGDDGCALMFFESDGSCVMECAWNLSCYYSCWTQYEIQIDNNDNDGSALMFVKCVRGTWNGVVVLALDEQSSTRWVCIGVCLCLNLRLLFVMAAV